MRTHIIPLAIGALLLALLGAGCGGDAEPQAAAGHDEHAGHDHA